MAAGVAQYLAGLCACGLFYARVSRSSSTPVGSGLAVRPCLMFVSVGYALRTPWSHGWLLDMIERLNMYTLRR